MPLLSHTPRPWTSRELAILTENAAKGATVIAALTGRTTAAVKAAAHRHRISLRPRNERRGKVLGEPRTGTLEPLDAIDLRAAILDNDLDPARLEYHTTHVARSRRGELLDTCPICAARPIEVKSTGLCKACHLNVTTEAYRHVTSEQAAEREFAAERQRRHRAHGT